MSGRHREELLAVLAGGLDHRERRNPLEPTQEGHDLLARVRVPVSARNDLRIAGIDDEAVARLNAGLLRILRSGPDGSVE